MKKTITLILTLIIVGALSEVTAQKNGMLSNGFSIKAQIGFPSAAYGANTDADSDYKYGTAFGIQIGNQWYFNPKENYGFGLMVNWIDASAVRKRTDTPLGEFQRATADLAFLEVGPIGTYVLSEEMAIDAYYNLRPTSLATAYQLEDEDGEAYGGFGVTNAVGADFRYKLFVLGVEYVFGKVKVTQDSENLFEDGAKIEANSFRILLGVKF